MGRKIIRWIVDLEASSIVIGCADVTRPFLEALHAFSASVVLSKLRIRGLDIRSRARG